MSMTALATWKNSERRASVCFACQDQSVGVQSLLQYGIAIICRSPFIHFRTFPRAARHRVLFIYFCIFFKSLFCMSNKTILMYLIIRKLQAGRYYLQPHVMVVLSAWAGAPIILTMRDCDFIFNTDDVMIITQKARKKTIVFNFFCLRIKVCWRLPISIYYLYAWAPLLQCCDRYYIWKLQYIMVQLYN